MTKAKITFGIKYHNVDAENGQLDMYDAAVSFQGFAKAISITANALINEGKILKKGDHINGGDLYINPSRKGSFEQLVTLVINNAELIGVSIISMAFYDALKITWSATLNNFDYEPPHVKKIAQRIEPYLNKIEEALEVPLKEAHRPIKKDNNIVITIDRPRVGEVIRLNSDTLESLSLQVDAQVTKNIKGNVTRYNIITGYGRFYDDNLQRIISFRLDPTLNDGHRQSLTWSLHFAQEKQGEGKVLIDAKKTLTSRGFTKNYLITNVTHIDS